MELKANLLDEGGVKRALNRIAHEIIEKNKGVENVILVGLKSRGMPLAQHIQGVIKQATDFEVPVYELDPTKKGEKLFDPKGKRAVIVDDVMYTGRTVRAAMEKILSFGKAARVQLAVLIDRGHHELPIRPNFVGKNVPTAKNEVISVNFPPFDKVIGVDIFEL